MYGFGTIVNSILTLGLAMLVGFICVRTKYIGEDTKNALSQIIVKVTLPILIMTSLTKMTIDHTKIINCAATVICGWITVGSLFAVGNLTARLFKLEKSKAIMHACMTCFGNVVFIAYPLIQALYGDEGLLYAALFAFSSDCWLWTFGVYKMSTISGKNESIKDNLKKLINPATIAFVISFFMMITKLKFTGVIGEVLTGIGSVTTYLSMLFIGGTLAAVDFRHIYKRVSLFVLVLIKMLAFPMLLMLILRFIPIASVVKSVVVIQAAIPTSTVLTILTTKYDGDTVYSAEGVFITTLLSLVTLPCVYYIMQLIS